jgi:hypothetical protein
VGSNECDSWLSGGLGEQLVLKPRKKEGCCEDRVDVCNKYRDIESEREREEHTGTLRSPRVTVSSETKPVMLPEPYWIEKSVPLATYVDDLSWLYLRCNLQATSEVGQVYEGTSQFEAKRAVKNQIFRTWTYRGRNPKVAGTSVEHNVEWLARCTNGNGAVVLRLRGG